MKAPVKPAASETDTMKIIKSFQSKPGAMLGILETVQESNRHKYLPKETIELISQKTGVPLSRLHSISTFYSFFNLQPQGDHIVLVCRGTACHTRGSRILLEDLACLLGNTSFLDSGESSFTTSDKKFTVKTVACFGQCALSPVISVDGVIYSRMTTARMRSIVEKIAKGGKKK